MSRPEISVEFDALVDRRGYIVLPEGVVAKLGQHARVRVGVTSSALDEALRRKEVTSAEIDRIAALQFEPRRQVIAFILAEGSLSASRRRKRQRRPG